MSVNKLIQLKPDEHIIAVHRQYGGTYAGPMALTFLLIMAPFFFLAPLFALGPLGVALFFIILFVGIFYGLRKAMLWYRTMFIVTDHRIVDIDQRGFFDRTVSEVAYPKVQDISFRIKGIVPTMLHYGTVIIQTAGGTVNLELHRIKNPEQVVNLMNEFRERSPEALKDHTRQMVEAYLKSLSEEEMKTLVNQVRGRVKDEAMKKFFGK